MPRAKTTPSAAPTAAECDLLEELFDSVSREGERSLEIDSVTDAFRRPLVLVGSGALASTAMTALEERGVDVCAVADSSPERRGAGFFGHAITSPAEAARELGREAVFVLAYRDSDEGWDETGARLRALGVERVVSIQCVMDKWPELNGWGAHRASWYVEQADLARRVHAGLADPVSRGHFRGQLGWRTHRDSRLLPTWSESDQYFVEDVVALRQDEGFVDGGAFDGDSSRALLRRTGGRVGWIESFEPDPATKARLDDWVRTLPSDLARRIRTHGAALSDRPGTLAFAADGSQCARASASAGVSVPCVRLDDVLADRDPTFVKLDLEGGEHAALDGAAAVVARSRPVIALAVYHHADDLLGIPARLMEGLDDYRFHLRTHNRFGLDVVLYAVPEERPVSRG